MSHDLRLLLTIGLAVCGLVVLITRFKLHAFVALTLASLFVGVCLGAKPIDVTKAFAEGVGSVLGSVAMVIALGAVLGQTLSASRGAEQIASSLIEVCGKRGMPWVIALVGFLVGLPVFFGVGLVLLIPVVMTTARKAGVPFLCLALPLVAGLSVAHGLVPPHPGPIAATELLQADVGKTIAYGLLVGLPTVLICGPILTRFLVGAVKLEPEEHDPSALESSTWTGVFWPLLSILLPVLLMLFAAVADLLLNRENVLRSWTAFTGAPTVAMLIAVIFSFARLRIVGRFGWVQLGKMSEEGLVPVASILLVVGAGSGFSRVLNQSGAGDALVTLIRSSGLPPLLFGWLAAAVMRIAVGSSTVAISAASGLLVPVITATPHVNRELLVLSLGAGSLVLSHVNDGGFWFVKEYLNMSVTQTFRTWTIIETAISITALLWILLLSYFF